MVWRRWRPRGRRGDELSVIDYAASAGRHRLADGDVVPVSGYRRYADLLNDPTRELPMVDTNVPLRMTPGQQYRSGVRRWLP